MSASIALNQITKSFGQTRVLNGITLSIEEGEFFFLLGPSGCGKSTLLRLIAGFLTPDSGSIALHGKEISGTPPEERGISMVFQNYALWPHMTVAQNVAFGLEMRQVPKTETADRVRQALELVRISALAGRYPQELSGGQQQRVALARAIVVEPSILLLDEPLSNLDAKLRVEMRQELRSLHQRLGKTMIYVTHDQGEALSLGTRVALLNASSIVQVATPRELLTNPSDPFVSEFLGRTALLEGEVGAEGSVNIRSATIQLERGAAAPGQAVSIALKPENLIVVRS